MIVPRYRVDPNINGHQVLKEMQNMMSCKDYIFIVISSDPDFNDFFKNEGYLEFKRKQQIKVALHINDKFLGLSTSKGKFLRSASDLDKDGSFQDLLTNLLSRQSYKTVESYGIYKLVTDLGFSQKQITRVMESGSRNFEVLPIS